MAGTPFLNASPMPPAQRGTLQRTRLHQLRLNALPSVPALILARLCGSFMFTHYSLGS